MKIVSAARPSGKLHIGNYIGAIKNWLKLQNDPKNKCFFFIADLHAMTTPFKPEKLNQDILEIATEYLAAGIDPKKSTFFIQSHITEHAELGWIFNCITPLGELYRMTQFKDKSEENKENINAGLLGYPVLMAADILMYKAEAVPVGEDQVQHVELTRDIAHRFNSRFGKTFPEPKTILTETSRIMSLVDPAKKMPKSGGDEMAYIALTDSPEVIMKKIKSAVSDIGGGEGKGLPAGRQGGNNLLAIFKAFAQTKSEKLEYEKFAKDHKAGNLKYAEFKPRLAELIADYFADFRKKHAELSKNPEYVKKVLAEGAEKASAIAEKTLWEIKEKVGLVI